VKYRPVGEITIILDLAVTRGNVCLTRTTSDLNSGDGRTSDLNDYDMTSHFNSGDVVQQAISTVVMVEQAISMIMI
jgi:hypothetical protein